MADEELIEKAPSGWEDRQLCPNGDCIGVLHGGICTECGAIAPGSGLDPRTRGLRSEEEVAEKTEENRVAHSTPTAPADWDDRQLCEDGACIGVIGEDGVCTECGQTPADVEEARASLPE